MKNPSSGTPLTSPRISKELIVYGVQRLNKKHTGLPMSERDDVLQEAMLDYNLVVEKGGRIDSPEAFLAVIIDRCAATAAERLKRRRENEIPAGNPDDLNVLTEGGARPFLTRPATTNEEGLFADKLNAAVRGLPLREAQVFILCDLRGLSQEVAASILNMSQPTLSRLLDQARDTVKEAVA